MKNGYRESDSPIVSEKPSNKTGDNKPEAEKVERRGLAERNPSKRTRSQAQNRILLPHELERIRYAAQQACASLLEAGAQCISSARWDLCGGCRVIGIPTAISHIRRKGENKSCSDR